MAEASKNKPDTKTSEILSEAVENFDGSHIAAGDLIYQFQRRSYGGVLLLLAILALIPGVSIFAGLAMFVPAYQLLIGMPAPVFPKTFSKREVSTAALKKWSPKVIYWVAKLENLIKPRWPELSGKIARRILGLIIIILALVLTVPFPFSNFPPSLAVMCFALGLLERDGLMIAIGAAVSLVACTIGFLVMFLVLDWLGKLF